MIHCPPILCVLLKNAFLKTDGIIFDTLCLNVYHLHITVYYLISSDYRAFIVSMYLSWFVID